MSNRSVASPGTRPAVSVVVTAGPDPGRTAACLRSLDRVVDRDAGPVEVLVVETVATPATAGRAGGRQGHRSPPRAGGGAPWEGIAGASAVRARGGRTLGARRNVGARAAAHDVLVFLDDRLDGRDGWLEALVGALGGSGDAAAAGARVELAGGRLHGAGAWLVDDRNQQVVRPVPRWYGESVDRPGAASPAAVRILDGSVLAVARAAFDAVGGFDEAYRRGFEDADLGLRLAALGRASVYEPRSVLAVAEGATVERPWAAAGDDARRFSATWRGRTAVDVVVRTDRSVVPGVPARSEPVDEPVRGGPTVRWVGSLFGQHSLAQVNRELAVRLVGDHGHRIDPVWTETPEVAVDDDRRLEPIARAALGGPIDRADVTVHHGWPPNWTPPTDGSPWVVLQPWEFGCLPASWVPPLRDLVDEYWVYTEWLRRCAIASGVPAHKVRLLPIGVDGERLRPDGPRYPLATSARTRLLFVGGAIKRKGIDVLVESYLRAFTPADDVCLVLKLTGAHSFYKGSLDDRLRALAARRDIPAIEIVDDGLTNDQIADLYRACTALVHPYRGEGFGMPIAEAMACGLPVVVTGEGAARDFCHAYNSYLVPAVNVPLDPGAVDLGPPAGEYWLAEPDRDELIRLLRHVHAHPDEAAARGAAGRSTVLEQLDWGRIAATAAADLGRLVGRTPRRLDPLGAFDPAVTAVALDDPRSTTVLLEVAPGDAWLAPLRAWVETFGAVDDVTLVLVAAAECELEAVAAHTDGFDGDILVVWSGGEDHRVASAYAACDHVLVSSPATAERAARMGRPTITAGSVGALRASSAAAGSRPR